MTDEEKIIEAIRTATNGTFIGDGGITTLMGFANQYDDQGRLVTANPNYTDSIINIEGTTYRLTRKGWYACVWNPKYEKACYTYWWLDDRENYTIGGLIDLRPDYVKEWEEKRKNKK